MKPIQVSLPAGRGRFASLGILLVFLLTSPALAQAEAVPEEPAPVPAPAIAPEQVGSGMLLMRRESALHPLPLEGMEVEILVTGLMVRGTVTQTFVNPTDGVIEAIYLFPLPERAAVDHMEMRIGTRRIVSRAREREEARRTYETARREGKKAALLEQHRPNLFSTAVANINPGEKVRIVLAYLQEADWRDGEFSHVLPLAYTRRFSPSGGRQEHDHPGLDAPAGPLDGIPRVRVKVHLHTGLPLQEMGSDSHRLLAREEGKGWVLEPAGESVAADRDLRLHWRPARGREPLTALLTEEREDGRYALLMVVPPDLEAHPDVGLPAQTLFILDVSGSMKGPSICQARAALRAALAEMRPGDSFNIMTFSDVSTAWRPGFQPVEAEVLQAAAAWVGDLEAGGGTMILPALQAALEMMGPEDPGLVRRILFITDGAVGNEHEVFATVARGLGDVRLHVLGIGHAPNAYLMCKMAAFGRGLCDFVHTTEGAGNVIGDFFARLRRPVMTELSLHGQGWRADEVYPERLPDLYTGEPLVISFRLNEAPPPGSSVLLEGRTYWGWFHRELALEKAGVEAPGIATRWARARIGALMDRLHEGADEEEVRRQVVELGLTFHLATRYTSLVAVEEVVTAEGPGGTALVTRPLAALPRGGTAGPLRLGLGLVLTLLGLAGALLLLPGRVR